MGRRIALLALVGGAAGSLAFFAVAASHTHPPPFLLALFVAWVVSPFAALGATHAASKRLSPKAQTALMALTIVLAIASSALYGVAALAMARPTPVFTATPPISWALLIVTIPTAAILSRRRSRQVG